MNHTSTHTPPLRENSAVDELLKVLEHASHVLPAQGPISVFVHHNTLHAFEHLPFEQAVVQAAEVLGSQPYRSEAWYRQEYVRGRIKDRDLQAVVEREDAGGDLQVGGLSRREIHLALLRYDLHQVTGPALRWHLHETGALRRFREEVNPELRNRLLRDTLAWVKHSEQDLSSLIDPFLDEWNETSPEELLDKAPAKLAIRVLWTACRRAVGHLPAAPRPRKAPSRHRDFLLKKGARDSDTLVHQILIRFCAAFLDQGIALNTLPHRDQGLYLSFRELYSVDLAVETFWLNGLSAVLRDERQRGLTSVQSAVESLQLLAVPREEWGTYVRDTLLALRGWAGMIHQAHLRPDRLPVESVPATLTDFLAVRLLLERFALSFCAREHGLAGDLASIRQGSLNLDVSAVTCDSRAFELYQLVEFLGLGPQVISQWTPSQLEEILQEVDRFNDKERRQLFHLAYERRLRVQTLDALCLHPTRPRPAQPQFQAIFCIDEREESTRRHLEEIAPWCETFSTLGYFSIPMYFKAIQEPHPVALCPVSIRPRHLIREVANESAHQEAERLAAIRRSLGRVAHTVEVGSQTLHWGGLLTSGLGAVSALPALFRVLFPGLAGRFGKNLRKRLLPSQTRLEILRESDQTEENGLLPGFSRQEMVSIVKGLLQEIGLVKDFSKIVLVVGHGSSCLNNPHEAAYDCGACGGGRGGPNARAFAWMANEPGVRRELAEQGIVIPEETRFVGAYHNTCDDDVDLYDLSDLTPDQLLQLENATRSLHESRGRDAQERCRRFETADFDLSPRGALKHVEERAEDLAQPRPEYGHASNAICVVGRRQRTQGLFLDRRAFLASYDPTQDDEQGTTLGRLLRSVVPVGAGINLEYFFSFVDNVVYGCGTKLPHNITGLVGVMDGFCSDLRTGLAWQMVEIHEPVRLLTVIETRPSVIEAVLQREDKVRVMAQNGWVQVALLDPESQQILLLDRGQWVPYQAEASELPVVHASVEWFHHHREHLAFAEIEPDVTTESESAVSQCSNT